MTNEEELEKDKETRESKVTPSSYLPTDLRSSKIVDISGSDFGIEPR